MIHVRAAQVKNTNIAMEDWRNKSKETSEVESNGTV